MPPSRGVLYADLELAQAGRVAVEDARQPELLDLLLEPGREAGVHAAAAREDDGLEEGGAHVDVGGLDGLEQELGDAGLLAVDEVGLEEALGGLEPLAPHADDAAVGQRVALDQHCRVLAKALVQFQVVRHVAELLLDLPHRLEVRRPVQRVSPSQQQRDQVAGDVSPGHVESPGEVVEDHGFVDGNNMRDTIAGIDDHTGA